MIRRTLMQRNRELVDFEVDSETGEVRIIDTASDDLAVSAGLTRQNGDGVLARLIERRAISPMREDKDDVLAAFGAQSPVDLALRGHGLSLSDQFWYRVSGSTERWEDINFFDNEWDPGFGVAVFNRNYAGLASCSPSTPDATTCGRSVKMWERGDNGIFLIKESLLADGSDLVGVKLASDLCAALFGNGCHVPTSIVERNGKPCSASPLMVAADEEFADGNQLCAIAGIQEMPDKGDGCRMSKELLQSLIEAYAAIGVEDASAHIARMACCNCLALITDSHPGNFGIIRKVGSDAWRPAPFYDLEGSFGFSSDESKIRVFLTNPDLAKLFCASRFSFLDPSWDWSWYDPQALEGFEDHIVEALAANRNSPPKFGETVADLFAMQRSYVNEVASNARRLPSA